MKRFSRTRTPGYKLGSALRNSAAYGQLFYWEDRPLFVADISDGPRYRVGETAFEDIGECEHLEDSKIHGVVVPSWRARSSWTDFYNNRRLHAADNVTTPNDIHLDRLSASGLGL